MPSGSPYKSNTTMRPIGVTHTPQVVEHDQTPMGFSIKGAALKAESSHPQLSISRQPDPPLSLLDRLQGGTTSATEESLRRRKKKGKP